MFFADSNLDTIKYCSIPLTYINAQIEYQGNIISDTLNWVPITGTFVANGSEKYMMLGNFRTNAATNTLVINPTYLPSLGTDILIDDVSVIELNLPAFAGQDTSVAPGSSVFIGRQPDVGIDEACVWYRLPGATPLDTIAGFWVNPAATTTYVVVQTICGLVKNDTVVIHMNLVGLEKIKMLTAELKIYPVPAGDYFSIGVTNEGLLNGFNNLQIINSLGQLIREEEIKFIEGQAKVKTIEISAGCYSVILWNENGENVSKKLLIAK